MSHLQKFTYMNMHSPCLAYLPSSFVLTLKKKLFKSQIQHLLNKFDHLK